MPEQPKEDRSLDRSDLDHIRIVLSLSRLGELIAHTAAHFCELRGIEPPDFDGEEMRELAISGWNHCLFMSDREAFKESVAADLEQLGS